MADHSGRDEGHFDAPIDAIRVVESWAHKHWTALQHAYARAPHFPGLASRFEALYQALGKLDTLSAVNRRAIEEICAVLGIDTPIHSSREYPVRGIRTDRLLSICIAAGATEYVSGPSARAYMELEKFADAGIAVRFVDYAGYPEYPQLHGPFVQGVSILDLLFNLGDNALSAMRKLA